MIPQRTSLGTVRLGGYHMSELVTLEAVRGARRVAVSVDLAAVAASTAANIGDALLGESSGAGAVAVAVVAPVGLCLAIMLWHRSQIILSGGLGHLFNAGLAAVAMGAAVVSFGHIRSVATHFGQNDRDATIIALVIDGAAVLAAVVIVAAGQKIGEISAAADRQQREQRQVVREAEVARQAELRATRQAQMEAARPSESHRGRQLENGQTKTVPKKTASGRGSQAQQAIGEYLAKHPEAKQTEVAAAVGVSASTVKRSVAWSSRKVGTNGQTTGASS